MNLLESKVTDALAELLLLIREHPVTLTLSTVEQQREAIKEEIKGEVHGYVLSIKHGSELLTERLDPNLRGEFIKMVMPENLTQKIEEGLSLWQIFGLSQEFMDCVHREAVKLYTEHHLEDARDAFLFLIALSHWDQRFWIGYGLSEQFSPHGDINKAVLVFKLAIALDGTNPYPYVYYADAMVQMKEPKVAHEYYALALQQIGQQQQFANLKEYVLRRGGG